MKPLLYYIKADATHYYALDDNNNVYPTTVPTPVPDPIDWNETKLSYKRYSGTPTIGKTYSAPLSFPFDGAKILRHLFALYSYQATAQLEVRRLNTSIMQYEVYYISDLNFYKINHFADYVQIPTIEGGLQALLKSYSSTTYEIPIDSSDCINVLMDGVQFQSNYNWGASDLPTAYAYTGQVYYFPMAFINFESVGVLGNTIFPQDQQEQYSKVDSSDTINSSYRFVKSNIPISGNYSIDFKGTCSLNAASNNATFTLFLLKTNDSGTPISAKTLYEYPTIITSGSINKDVSFKKSGTFPIEAGYSYYLAFCLNAVDAHPNVSQIKINNIDFNYSFASTLPATQTQAYLYYQVVEKLVNKLTGGKYGVDTTILRQALSEVDYYDAIPANDAVTCGDALRRLPGSTLKLSFDDIQKDLLGRMGLGIGISNNTIVIDEMKNFYKKGVRIADLGQVKDFSILVAEDYLASGFMIGYAEQDYNDDNGKYEFNNTHTYNLPILEDGKQLDLTSPFRTDMLGIEYARANLDGKTTTDASSDNDVFLLALSSTPGNPRILNRGATISGYPYPDRVFNLGYSPKRCFLRGKRTFKSILYGVPNKVITFQTTEKNADIISTWNAGRIVECEDVNMDNVPADILFKPSLFKFTGVSPRDFSLLIDADLYGDMAFSFREANYVGFIIDITAKPAGIDEVDFTVLATPDCDMSQNDYGYKLKK